MASKTLYVGDKAVFDDGLDNTPAGQTTPAAGKFTQAKTAKGADVASANEAAGEIVITHFGLSFHRDKLGAAIT